MVIEGFTRRSEEIEELARKIKSTLGVGGTVKNSRIEIQGDCREKVAAILQKLGFQVKNP